MQALERTSIGSDVAGGFDLRAPVEVVKWETPADELIGTAKLVRRLIEGDGVRPNRVCLAAPNRAWAVQARRACTSVGVNAVVCVPSEHLSANARCVLARLDAMTCSDSDSTRAALTALNCDEAEANQLADEYRSSRGFTLARVVGLADLPEAACALLHMRGDEDAETLRLMVVDQLFRPTVPDHAPVVPVRHGAALDAECDWLFLLGCVDGLVPGPQPYEAASPQQRASALAAGRDAFYRALACACERAVISSFCKIEADIATAAGVRCTRFKIEHGVRMAMVAPTPFLDEAGVDRPATIGGQAFLRSFDLN